MANGSGGLLNVLAVLFSGGAGVTSAMAADFFQKGEASSIFVMNILMNQLMSTHIPLLYMAGGLLVIVSLAVFAFEPRNNRSAFFVGAGILAMMMTGIPIDDLEDNAPVIQGIIQEVQPSNSIHSQWGSPYYMPANYTLVREPSYYQVGTGTVPVTVAVAIPGSKGSVPKDISGRLHDRTTGTTWRLSRGIAKQSGSGIVIEFTEMVPVNSAGEFAVRIEAEGYKIQEGSTQVSPNQSQAVIAITLQESDVPLLIQRASRANTF